VRVEITSKTSTLLSTLIEGCCCAQTPLTGHRVYFVVYKTACHLVFRTVGPLLVLTVLNCCLAQSLRDVRRRRQRITGAASSAYCKVPGGGGGGGGTAGRGRQRENITAMVVAVICVFIVCELPDVALRLAVTVAQLLVRFRFIRIVARMLKITKSPTLLHSSHSSTGMDDRLPARKPPQYFTEPPRPTQPPNLSRTGNKYRQKCGDALRMGSKGRVAHFMRG